MSEAKPIGERGPGGSVPFPIFESATWAFENTAELEAYLANPSSHYFYTRYANPTNDAAARALAALEGAEEALLFSSGMGAITSAVMTFVGAGDEALALRSLYGGTLRLLREVLPRFGVRVSWFDPADALDAIRSASAQAKIVYFESPTNPVLEILDVAAIAASARERGLISLFDGTFASPANQKPLALGVDLVLHSATKFLGGHADVVAGAAAGSHALVDRVRATMKVFGTSLDPFAAFLMHRGMKTLDVRASRQNESAGRIAAFLAEHARVRRVLYPGLPSHAGHAIARRQMSGFGGMLTFEVDGGLDGARRVIDRFRVILNAPSLGSVESLASLPVLTSHHGFPPDEMRRAGVTDGMIRISVGVEPVDDLIADLARALEP